VKKRDTAPNSTYLVPAPAPNDYDLHHFAFYAFSPNYPRLERSVFQDTLPSLRPPASHWMVGPDYEGFVPNSPSQQHYPLHVIGGTLYEEHQWLRRQRMRNLLEAMTPEWQNGDALPAVVSITDDDDGSDSFIMQSARSLTSHYQSGTRTTSLLNSQALSFTPRPKRTPPRPPLISLSGNARPFVPSSTFDVSLATESTPRFVRDVNKQEAQISNNVTEVPAPPAIDLEEYPPLPSSGTISTNLQAYQNTPRAVGPYAFGGPPSVPQHEEPKRRVRWTIADAERRVDDAEKRLDDLETYIHEEFDPRTYSPLAESIFDE